MYVTANGLRQREDVLSGGSFASSNDQRVHFGLGPDKGPIEVEIDWPDQKVERMHLPAIDRIFTIVEGKGVVEKNSTLQ